MKRDGWLVGPRCLAVANDCGGWGFRAWSRGPSLGVVLAVLSLLSATIPAQSSLVGRAKKEPWPGIVGEWAGPYQLRNAFNPGGGAEWAEIVHIVTLPPPNDGLVLLWNRRDRAYGGGGPPINRDQLTWLWDSAEPYALLEVPIPGTSSGTLDIFCGAQTLVAGEAGEVLAIAGTNMQAWLSGQTVGSAGVFAFDNASAAGLPGPLWRAEPSLNDIRYYNGCLRESNGTIVTYGSAGPEGQPGGQPLVEYNREELGSLWTRKDNVERVGMCDDTSKLYPLASGNYPDVHLLSTGNWLRVDGGPSTMLDKLSCDPGQPPAERFQVLTTTFVPRNFGNSAHILSIDDLGQRREVLYAIGGNEIQGCGGVFYNTVLKMVAPTVAGDWADSPPDLAVERHTGNAIILLDGSILEVGGARQLASGAPCIPVQEVELYRPPEVFTRPSLTWAAMAPLVDPRTYHSVAALLPDGSVVVGGGVGTNLPPGVWQSSWTSLEVYKPPYFFQPGPRPRIDLVTSQSTVWSYGEEGIVIDVALMNEDGGEFRVALLSPCAGTHGVDFNQRYVELRPSQFTPVEGGARFEISAPEDGNVAPPGWYMLTVVNKDGLPSEAQWVRVGI